MTSHLLQRGVLTLRPPTPRGYATGVTKRGTSDTFHKCRKINPDLSHHSVKLSIHDINF